MVMVRDPVVSKASELQKSAIDDQGQSNDEEKSRRSLTSLVALM